MQVSAQRGTAMIESAIFLPLFLLVLFGIIWAVQSSVQSERVQIAVRYDGFVSNEAAPYVGYSLYGLYLAAAAPFLLGKLTDVFRAPPGTERAAHGLSDFTLLSSLGSQDNALRYAALAVASVYLLGLLVLPFAPETRGQPLPE